MDQPAHLMQPIRFAGLIFNAPTRLDLAAVKATQRKLVLVVTVNADMIVSAHKIPRFAEIINNNASTFDGQIPFVLARSFGHPRGVPIEKLSGSDLVLELLEEAARERRRVLLLGASLESNVAATRVAHEKYGAEVLGYSPPITPYPFAADWREECRRRIADFHPHYIFVALGAPKQEFWMDEEKDWLDAQGVQLCIGCGGSLDFLSGRLRRAPPWIQRVGLEGLYRLIAEPRVFRVKRLLRSLLIFRYLLS